MSEKFTIEFNVKQFGKWTLGYSLVTVSLFGGNIPALALYACKDDQKPARKIVGSLKEAIGFFADLKVPPKSVATVLRQAESEGWAI